MEIKKLLNEEFKQEESRIKNDKSKVGDQSFLSTDKFLNNFDNYHKKILAKKDEYKEKVTKTNDKYKTRLSKQAIFDQAKALYDQGNFYEAYYIFETILEFGSSREYFEICTKELDALYEKASDLAKNYQYQEAIDILNSIINYRDSKKLIEEYKKWFEIDKNYLEGIDLFNAQKFMDAYKMFMTLGDYRDSKDYFSKCDNELLKIYLGANELKEKQKYDEATQIFKNIIDYKDSRKIIKEIVGLKDRYLDLDQQYQEAVDLFNKGRWMEAYLMFCFIEDHRDSKDYIFKCEKEIDALYLQALDLKNEYRYQEAINIFRTIEEYDHSLDQISECEKLIEFDKRYFEAVNQYNNHNYFEALNAFIAIKYHRDSKDYIAKCRNELDAIYNLGITNFKNNELDEALKNFQSIELYRDSKDYIEKIKKKQKENAILVAKRQKRKKLFFILGAVSAVVVTALVLTFVVFIPQAKLKQNQDNYAAGMALIQKGNYEEASQKLNGLNYQNSNDLYCIALAGKAFQDDDYNSGIENMCLAKGKTNVTYDGDGGTTTKTSETITTYTPISVKPTKEYYDFMDWDVANFNIDINETNYTCSLALKAKYELTKYKITYVLNGGTNSQSNPDTYTYESNNINLSNPTRSGYVFKEWTLNNEQVASIPKHSHGDVILVAVWNKIHNVTYNLNGGINNSTNPTSFTVDDEFTIKDATREGYKFVGWNDGTKTIKNYVIDDLDADLTLTAVWEPIVYSITLDPDGGILEGDTVLDITFDSYPSLPIPVKEYHTFEGWYYGDTKIGSKWDIPLNCTVKAKWNIPCQEYLTYTKYNNYIRINGISKNFAELIIPETIDNLPVTEIISNAFENNTVIQVVYLPDSLTKIGERAFYNCTSLKTLILSKNLSSIGAYAFRDCSSLKTIKAKVDSSSKYAIPYLFSTISHYISASSFVKYPSSLTDIIITSGSVIPSKFFALLPSTVTNITFIDDILEIGDNAFLGADYFVLPKTVTKIGEYAYSTLGNIGDEFTIHEGVQIIGDWAFESAYFKTVNLPSTLTKVGRAIFGSESGSNYSLKTINYNGTKNQWLSLTNTSSHYDKWDYNLNYSYKVYCKDAYFVQSISGGTWYDL